jgi:hypothetical protein
MAGRSISSSNGGNKPVDFFTWMAAFLIAIGYFSFIKGTVQGTMDPHSATWTVWFVQDGLMAASAVAAGIGPAAVLPVVWAIGATIMCPLSYKYGSRDPFTPLERGCLILSGCGVVLWAVTGSPMTALVTSVATVTIGGIPTILKAWRDPESESASGWVLMLAATICVALAIQEWTFESGFVPVTVGIFQTVTLLPLLVHKFRPASDHVPA